MTFEKKLIKELKSNELKIAITNEEYNKINMLINNLSKEYKEQINNFNTKENFDKIKSHNLLIKNIISQVLDEFIIFKEYNVCAFLTGSFARNTNKLNSDLDFHLCYKNKYKKQLFKYEELFYYILSSIFDLDRTKVHNMIGSRLNNKHLNKIIKKIDQTDLTIKLTNESNIIEYTIPAFLKYRIYMQYINTKELSAVYKYLKKEILGSNSEWCHVFYVFTNKEVFFKYYKKLFKLELEHNSIKKISKRIERINNKLEYINDMKDKINKNSVSDCKRLFQIEEFKLLFEVISYKRDLYLLDNTNNNNNVNDDNITNNNDNNLDNNSNTTNTNNNAWSFINIDTIDIFLPNDIIIKYIKNYFLNTFKIMENLKNKFSIHQDCYIDSKYYETLEKELNAVNNIIRRNI